MTAKEMFKKLGFEQEDRLEDVISYRKNEPPCQGLIFSLKDKICMAGMLLIINDKLCKAIQKQLEELGWLE